MHLLKTERVQKPFKKCGNCKLNANIAIKVVVLRCSKNCFMNSLSSN